MANHTFNDVTEIHVLPVYEIIFTSSVGGFSCDFYYINDSSSFSVKPITRPNDAGGETAVALEFVGSFNILQNNIGDMREFLSDLETNGITDFDMSLRDPFGFGADKLVISADESINVKSWDAHFNVQQQGDNTGPQMQFNVRGIMSLDVLDMVTYPLFRQVNF